MSRRVDPLDASLSRLCSLAEKFAVLFERIEVAREGFSAFRFDPDARAADLTRLAAVGRECHTQRQFTSTWAQIADMEASEAAQAAYDAQASMRDRLAAVATLEPDPIVARDLSQVRRHLRLKSARVTGALDTFRRLHDTLSEPEHAVLRHTATATLGQEVLAHVMALEALHMERERTHRDRWIAVQAADRAREDLRAALRQIRQMGEVVSTLPDFPEGLFDELQSRPAPRRGLRTPHDGGATTHEHGAPTHDGGAPTHDGGAPTHEHGAPTHEGGATTHEGGEP